MIRIELPYPRITANRRLIRQKGSRRFINNPKVKEYYEEVQYAAIISRSNGELPEQAVDEPCLFILHWYPPDNRVRDADNVEKLVKDGMTHAKIWQDDHVAVQTYMRKMEKTQGGRIIVWLYLLSEYRVRVEVESRKGRRDEDRET